MSKNIGSLLQVVGLLYFLVLTIGGSATGLYSLITGEPSHNTFVGGSVVVLSFLGFFVILLLVVGYALAKGNNQGTYFSRRYIDALAQLVTVPLGVFILAPLAFISVPLAIYFFYLYKKGEENGVIRFTKWAFKDWRITVPWYISLVTIVTVLMLLME